jgi:hypothetical protein
MSNVDAYGPSGEVATDGGVKMVATLSANGIVALLIAVAVLLLGAGGIWASNTHPVLNYGFGPDKPANYAGPIQLSVIGGWLFSMTLAYVIIRTAVHHALRLHKPEVA